jgi:putative acetyltransferase
MEEIRRERQEDGPAVRRVLEAAFPTPAEANLVERLRGNGKAVIALVAEDEGEVVGHIVFSPLALDPLAGALGLGLGPIAVLPDHEKHGVGRRLVQNGLAACRKWGAGFVSVLGEPDYYGRFGFDPASAHGLRNEFGVDEHFMVFELKKRGLPPRDTLIRYAPEFAGLAKPLGGDD